MRARGAGSRLSLALCDVVLSAARRFRVSRSPSDVRRGLRACVRACLLATPQTAATTATTATAARRLGDPLFPIPATRRMSVRVRVCGCLRAQPRPLHVFGRAAPRSWICNRPISARLPPPSEGVVCVWYIPLPSSSGPSTRDGSARAQRRAGCHPVRSPPCVLYAAPPARPLTLPDAVCRVHRVHLRRVCACVHKSKSKSSMRLHRSIACWVHQCGVCIPNAQAGGRMREKVKERKKEKKKKRKREGGKEGERERKKVGKT